MSASLLLIASVLCTIGERVTLLDRYVGPCFSRRCRRKCESLGEVLDAAFRHAQAIVVLLTPADEVRLAPELWRDSDGPSEREAARQPRANVLFEAGMAIARDERRTVLIEFGTVKSFSDIAGRHVVKLNKSAERRNDVVERLRTAGCSVSTVGRDWLSIGGFTF